jgi:hypothetical protein
VGWAHFETSVQSMIHQAANVTPPIGRIAVREPRATDRLEMLHELIQVRGGTWNHELYKSILSKARLIEPKRDLVAHGMWILTDAGWDVRLARGSWPKNVSEYVRGSKKANPESIPMDLGKLRTATKEIDDLIQDLEQLRKSARSSRPPSPEK